ncbi:MAG: Bacterial dnaA protein helix-turn-helix [Candidatus Parcubacteria bacterium]|jgi:chromosomal replication initiation ATPase DnaA
MGAPSIERKVAKNTRAILTAQDEERLIDGVCAELGIRRDQLTSHDRRQYFVQARTMVALHLHNLGVSYPRIGKILKRDHTTAMHAVESAKKHARDNPEYRAVLEKTAPTKPRPIVREDIFLPRPERRDPQSLVFTS